MARLDRSSNFTPDLGQLEIFVSVVERKSMVEAGVQLQITQPAVSKAIASLEARLGVLLLDRSQRPLQPTRAGQILHQRAVTLLQEAQSIPSLIGLAANRSLPRIRIGVVESFTATGAPFVKALQGLAQEVRISCSLTPELARGLRQWDLDFVITSDLMEEEADLTRRALLNEPFILALPREQAYSGTIADLRAIPRTLPYVRYTTRSMIGRTIDQHLARLKVKSSNTLEFDTSTPLLQMVTAGLGWAVTTPLCLLQSRADRTQLNVAALPSSPMRKLYLVHRNGELGELSDQIFVLASGLLKRTFVQAFGSSESWIIDQTTIG